jgi:hypothetical protein
LTISLRFLIEDALAGYARTGDKPRRRDQPRSPVSDLSAYSRGPQEDDYRHLMLMNLLAFLVLSLIVFCGIWLADGLSQGPKDQGSCPSAGSIVCRSR